MKKTIKKATLAFIILGSVLGAALVVALAAVSVWANQPRGIRIKLDEE